MTHAEHLGIQAMQFGREVSEILAANGPEDPRDWDQSKLRELAAAMADEGYTEEADGILRYADARLAWSKAIPRHNRSIGMSGTA